MITIKEIMDLINKHHNDAELGKEIRSLIKSKGIDVTNLLKLELNYQLDYYNNLAEKK